MFQKELKVFVPWIFCFTLVVGHPNGAPASACTTMMPKHLGTKSLVNPKGEFLVTVVKGIAKGTV